MASSITRGIAAAETSPLEIWGGVEYTCNRVGDCYFNQLDLSGHANRASDYAEFQSLGIRTFRVGLLWERHERDPSWKAFEAHLSCMQGNGMRPVASLLHHGSGPPHTSLLDPLFPEKLASYAEDVATRFPWIDAYTPVNEPHTTARFSGLYGVWYPHHRSRLSYLRALLNQVKATVLSMESIRRIRPDARLIQTEDVGNISSTAELQATCDLLSVRRWLPYDLLCGSVDRHHPMFAYLLSSGISEREIHWFSDHPCPPSVIGVNYYVTSDRFLDHRLDLYPDRGSSAEGAFVDVEAVRTAWGGVSGVESVLTDAWERFRIPVAITEVHLGCTPDEQIRWLVECWQGATRARERGVSCVALTVWALLGSFFWNELVTHDNGHYEPGVFDIRSGTPIPTELAGVAAQLAHGLSPRHSALKQPGWWRRRDRVCYGEIDQAVCVQAA